MSQSHVIPAEVDDVRVTTIVDNAIDVLMASTDVAEQYMLGPKWLLTVSTLQEIGPRYVVPGHCTGWAATHRIAQAMPEVFIQNSVGTEFVFRAAD